MRWGCLLGVSAEDVGSWEPLGVQARRGWVLQGEGIAPSWHPIVITHLSGWTVEEIEGLSGNPAASFSLPISVVVIEPGRSPRSPPPFLPPSLPHSILRGNAALCPGNEILTHPTLFTIPDRRRGEQMRGEEPKHNPTFSHLQKSSSQRVWGSGSGARDWKKNDRYLMLHIELNHI